MIPDKTLVPPKRRKKTVRIDAAALSRAARAKKCVLHSLRQEDGRLVPAAGTEKVGDLSGDCTGLFYADGRIFAFSGSTAVCYPGGQRIAFGTNIPLAVAAYAPEHAEADVFFAAQKAIRRLHGSTLGTLGGVAGGDTIAVHRERIFLGSGCVLAYSAPLAPGTWEQTEDGAGSIDLAATGGDILDLIPFADRLYVFRENEILILRADAESLNFGFERAKFSGKPIAGTAQCTEAGIVFRTDRGLYLLTEGGCKAVRGAFPLELGSETAAWDGRYFALSKDGSCIYVYDPALDEEHLLDIAADRLTGGNEGLYLGHGTAVVRLTERGLPANGSASMELELCTGDAGGGARYLTGVTLQGEGTFTAECSSGGIVRTVEVAAGTRALAAQVLRAGVLKLVLRTQDPSAVLDALELHFEEDAT